MPIYRTTTRATLTFALLVGGCGEPDATRDAGPPDARVEYPECTSDAPIVAGTAETDALADAPARCGLPEYAWLRSAELGTITERGRSTTFTVEKVRNFAAVAGIALPEGASHEVVVENFAYVTQDQGELVEASGLIAMPSDMPEGATLDVVLLLHGTSGYGPGCGATSNVIWQVLAAALASFGKVVVEPDYLGLEGDLGEPYGRLHPYMIGEPTALAALDAVRAARNYLAENDGAICATSRVGIFGASQGGHAAFWVDRLAPYYAREIEIVGGVAAVPPTRLLLQGTDAISEPKKSTPNFLAAIVADAPWYGLDGSEGEVLVDALAEGLPAQMAESCDPDLLDRPDTLEEVFQPAFLADVAANGLGTVEGFGCPIRENDLVETTYPHLERTPMLVMLASEDREVNPAIERESFGELCAMGQPMAFLECAGAEHVDAVFWTVDEAVKFLDARFAGEPLPEGSCEVSAPVRCSGTPDEVVTD